MSPCGSTAPRQRLELLIAPQGGENVEQSAKLARIPIDGRGGTPEAIFPAIAKLFPPDLAARLARYAARLPDIARQEDLELLEINPLALTEDGSLVACDAKIIRDDSRRLPSRSRTSFRSAARSPSAP